MSAAKSVQSKNVAKSFNSMPGTMDRVGANAYLYAKASKMVAKSFVGPRLSLLFDADSLAVLWSHVIPKEVPQLPEVLLAQALEKEATTKFIRDYIRLLSAYEKPRPVLVKLLQIYDYSNLKDVAASLCGGAAICPDLVNIKPYNILHYDCWPDIKAMTANGPLAWYDTVPEANLQHGLDERLDKQYTRDLWESVCTLPGRQKKAIEPIIKMQIVFDNILWAIRLKAYFHMTREEIIPRLAFATAKMDAKDPLAQDALDMLDWPLDSRELWGRWKYRSMVNPPREGEPWRLDPRWTSRSFSLALQKSAMQSLHRHPEQEGVLVRWFLIKRFEVDCIRPAVERLRLNAERATVAEFLRI
jgi:vacuolar-type H+-ATPase subunit C/Vma6